MPGTFDLWPSIALVRGHHVPRGEGHRLVRALIREGVDLIAHTDETNTTAITENDARWYAWLEIA